MKKTVICCLVIFLVGCTPSKKKYIVELSGTRIETDTVFADNDEDGFKEGVIRYFAARYTDSLTRSDDTVENFLITDDSGSNLLMKLPKKVTCQIYYRVKSMAAGMHHLAHK